MTDPLKEMQSFEVEPFKIDFTQSPGAIQKAILNLPFEQQQYWIDMWMATPEVRASMEKRNNQKIDNMVIANNPTLPKNVPPPDQHWQD